VLQRPERLGQELLVLQLLALLVLQLLVQLVFRRLVLQRQEQLVFQQQELLELGCWWFRLAFQQVFQQARSQRKEPNRKQPTLRITSSSSFSLQFFCELKTNVNQKQFAAQKVGCEPKPIRLREAGTTQNTKHAEIPQNAIRGVFTNIELHLLAGIPPSE
jgi:hypothetical protein